MVERYLRGTALARELLGNSHHQGTSLSGERTKVTVSGRELVRMISKMRSKERPTRTWLPALTRIMPAGAEAQ